MSRSFPLEAVDDERIDAGGLDAALTVRRTGTATSPDVDVSFTDEEADSGYGRTTCGSTRTTATWPGVRRSS